MLGLSFFLLLSLFADVMMGDEERSFPSNTPKSKEPQICLVAEDGANLSVRGPWQSQPLETLGAAIL